VIFGFRKGKDEIEEEEEEIDFVTFQPPTNGNEVNLAEHARLAQAGLPVAKQIISDALGRRAELIRVEPKGEQSSVTFTIDGVPYSGGRLSKQQGLAFTQITKHLAGLDVKVRKEAQQGGMPAEFDEKDYEIRVESVPVKTGERLLIHARDLSISLTTPDDLNIPQVLREKIREAAATKQGVITFCGPARSGTTTTTFAAMRVIDAYLYAVYSFADLQGRELPYATEFKPQAGDDYEATLNRIFRQEADVLFVDPLKDSERTKLILSLKDKACIAFEFSARDAAHGIAQLTEWSDGKSLAGGLSIIISQKLIRTLCDKCKQAYRPNPKLLAKLGLPEETKMLFRPPEIPEEENPEEEYEPCRKCGELGYYGRTAMFEFIEMTEEMKKLVSQGAKTAQIQALAKKEGMLALQKDGLRLVAEGVTSLEELQRAFKAK